RRPQSRARTQEPTCAAMSRRFSRIIGWEHEAAWPMKTKTWVNATALLLAAIHGAPQTLELGAVLPQLRGETLQGNPLVLPDAAKGKMAFLTITFSRDAGKRARAWSQRSRRIMARNQS
ncbi:MAG: hypothetical protein L0Z53_01350, partial [Acidobacteriales bacterium]|nr:hypothetical protein [Terriglobales bacterium]